MWVFNQTPLLELYHHGIPGMKWGHRKTEVHISKLEKKQVKVKKKNMGRADGDCRLKKARYSPRDKLIDQQLYGKSGAKRIERRVQKGYTKRVARGKESVRQYMIRIGSTFVVADFYSNGAMHKKMIINGKKVAKKLFDLYNDEKTRKTVVRISQNHNYDPIDVTWRFVD